MILPTTNNFDIAFLRLALEKFKDTIYLESV